MRILFIILLAIALLVVPANIEASNPDHPLSKYETDIGKFKEARFGNYTGYSYQRKIGEAIVEGDVISYVFDKEGQKVWNKRHWRDDLPEELPQNLITKDEAIELTGNTNVSEASLYYLSPDSDFFWIEPPPENPCWVIWEYQEAEVNETCSCTQMFGAVVDAVTGEVLASGTPPISNSRIPLENNVTVLGTSTEVTLLGVTEDGKYEFKAIIGGPKYLENRPIPIDPSWRYDNYTNRWVTRANLFVAKVNGTEAVVEYDGLEARWQPDLYVGTEKQNASAEQLLAIDPINENYAENTLQWNYTNITRNLRVIEGMLLEYYIVSSLPTDNISIVPNIVEDAGFNWTRRYAAWDSNGTPLNLTVKGDNLTLELETMRNATFPVTIDPPYTLTASAYDGFLEVYPAHDYKVAHNLDEATDIYDWALNSIVGQYRDDDQDYSIARAFIYFPTGLLPNSMEVTEGNLWLFGAFDYSDRDFLIQIQSGMPDYPEVPMEKSDYKADYYFDNLGEMVTMDFEVDDWNVIPLSLEGTASVNSLGWTKFALRSSRDIYWDGFTKPTGQERVSFYAYEMGKNYAPKLEIFYQVEGFEAFSMVGPYVYLGGCYGSFIYDAHKIEEYLEDMGYPTLLAKWPEASIVQSQISSDNTAVFFEMAHGGSRFIRNTCGDVVWSSEVKNWIEDYPKMPFTYLLSCDSMCDTGPNTFANAFTKNSSQNTAVVGFCGIGTPECKNCTKHYIDYTYTFFELLGEGKTVEQAFDIACNAYPDCCNETFSCARWFGDGNLRLVPKVYRESVSTSGYITGEVRDVNADLLSEVEVSLYEYGGGLYGSDEASPDYCIEVDQTGTYWLVANKTGWYEINITDMTMLPDYWINLTTPELLAAGYVFDFEGNYGLVPRACDMSYAMKSVNLWLFPPALNPEWGIDEWKAMDSIHSWQFPS